MTDTFTTISAAASSNRGGGKLSYEQQRTLLSAYARGADTAALAARFGIDVTTVRRYARRAGIFRGPKPRRPPEHHLADLDTERDRIERLTAYDRRSLTGSCCGDPPVGFSALEQRKARHD